MKNRVFTLWAFGFLALIVVLFGVIAASLVPQLHQASFQKALGWSEILFAVRLSVFTATVSSIIAIAFAIPAAYALSRYEFRCKKIINTVLFIPTVISPLALGAMLLIFFNTAAGRFFEENILRVVFEVPAVVFAQFIVIIGLAVSLLRSVFDYIDPDYENIARTLGADRWQTFRYILMPASRKGIVAAFLLVWARGVGEFGATVMLAGATTMKTETLPVAIYLSFASADIYNAVVLILISLSLGVIILFITQLLYADTKKCV